MEEAHTQLSTRFFPPPFFQKLPPTDGRCWRLNKPKGNIVLRRRGWMGGVVTRHNQESDANNTLYTRDAHDITQRERERERERERTEIDMNQVFFLLLLIGMWAPLPPSPSTVHPFAPRRRRKNENQNNNNNKKQVVCRCVYRPASRSEQNKRISLLFLT